MEDGVQYHVKCEELGKGNSAKCSLVWTLFVLLLLNICNGMELSHLLNMSVLKESTN